MNHWKYLCCYQTGLNHLEEHNGCQDYAVVRERSNCLSAALADGVGFFAHSEVAAKAATEATATWLMNWGERLLEEPEAEKMIVDKLLPHIKTEVRKASLANQLDENAMDCNLAFVFVMTETGKAIVGQLGDCALCLIGKNSYVLTDLTGSYGTATVLDQHASERLIVKLLDLDKYEIDTILLTSDGLENEIYRKNSNVVRKSAQFYANVLLEENAERLLKEKLAWLARNKPDDFDDDMSLVALTRATDPIELPPDPTWLCACGHRNNIIYQSCHVCHKQFIDVYPHLDMEDFPCLDAFFLHSNGDPILEKQILDNMGGRHAPDLEQKENTNFHEDPYGKDKGTGGQVVTSDQLAVTLRRNATGLAKPPVREQKLVGTPKQESEEDEAQEKPEKTAALGDKQGTEEKKTSTERRAKGDLFKVPPPLVMDPPEETGEEDCPEENTKPVSDDQPVRSETENNLHPVNYKHTTEEYEESELSPPKKRRGLKKGRGPLIVLGAAIAILLVLVVMLSMAGIGGSRGESWHELDDGTHYSGEMRNGKPHGPGILKDGSHYWIGAFRDGEKHGRFIVVNANDPDDSKYMDFDNGIQAGMQMPTVNPSLETCTVKAKSVRLRKAPGYDSGSTGVQIRQNDTVYLTKEDPVEQDDAVWVQVQTVDGAIGWCESGALFLENV